MRGGVCPGAVNNRWCSVTDVERRLTSPPLVVSSDCSRCSQTLVVFRKIVSEKQAKATSNLTKPLVTQGNTEEMLTAIDTAGTSNENLARFQARYSRWQREMVEHSMFLHSTLSRTFCIGLGGLRIMLFNWVNDSSTRSVAVDRALPRRVPMIEFVCCAAERIFNDCHLLLEEYEQWECSQEFLCVRCHGSCG